jgi:hypothetical protein
MYKNFKVKTLSCKEINLSLLFAAHGFKPLTMSRFIPRFTRRLADRVDGMWYVDTPGSVF